MRKKAMQAHSYNEARNLLDSYGDFHDCSIVCLIQDFAQKRVEIHIDNVFGGLESHSIQPGAIVFEQIEYLSCQIPYVGGKVRIEGVEVFEDENGFILKFELTTTEWMDSEEFKIIKADVKAKQIWLREHFF